MQTINVGIVGTGFIGKRHLDALSRIPQVRIAAVADASPQLAQETAQQYGARVCADVQQMLTEIQVDAIHNCTPTSLHYDINRQIIQAGKHLYCEKPLALNAQEGEELARLITQNPVANGVNLNYRMNAMVQEMHARVAGGEAGRPFLVTAGYVQDWMMLEDDYDWRLDAAKGGPSRAIADIGSHLFDTSQFVLGKRITAVCASLIQVHDVRLHYEKAGGTFSSDHGKLLGRIPVCNEDAANILVRFEDGTQGMFQVSQVSAGHKNDMRLRFDFSACSYEWRQENSDQLLIGHRNAPNQVLMREADALHPEAQKCCTLPAGHSEGWNDALYHAINAFYASIQNGTWQSDKVPYATIEEGAWVMKIIDACLRSSRTGSWTIVE